MIEPPYFYGHRNPEQHHTTGRRAWSLQHSEWCYPAAPCAGCAVQMAEDNPCPHCDGTGIAPRTENVETSSVVRDTRFGRIGDSTSGTLLCQWPGCGAEIYVEAHREDAVADEHWAAHTENVETS